MKKMFKLLCLWTVLFSFAVQSTGAAGLAAPVMPAPLAAARLMPPPVRAAAPASVARAPVAPKITPPAEWGYYVLAAGELVVEGVSSVRTSARERVEELLRRGLAAGRDAQALWLSAQALLSEPEAEPERYAPVDLAAVAVPPSPAPYAPPADSVSAAVVTASPADRILVVPEESRVEPPPVAIPAAVAFNTVLALRRPRPDWLTSALRSAAARSEAAAWLGGLVANPAPMAGAWQTGRGVRFRVIYLNPAGTTRADASGLLCAAGVRFERDPAQVLPARLWGTYPLYFHGDAVDYQIEIANTGKTALTDVDVSAVEEQFEPDGPGRRLPTAEGQGRVARLEPGQSVLLQASVRTPPQGYVKGNFEQTHVRVSAADGKGGSTVLADAPHAGMIDPPSEK